MSRERELLLLRHAKSAWDTPARTDFERPLAARGTNDAPRVGRYLAGRELVPDFVTGSGAERARQTAVLACAELGIAESAIRWDRRIYHAGGGTLLQVLREAPPDAYRVLIVGHNPGLEDLLQILCGNVPVPDDGKLLPTAAVARLRVEVAWRSLGRGTARLLDLVRARSLEG